MSPERMHLVRPSKALLPSYIEAGEEYRAHGVTTYAFMDPARHDILARIERFRTGVGLPEHYVRADYLWLEEDGRFIAEVSIRHALNSSLLRYGGHIGYGVRLSHWYRGVGTRLLGLALEFARSELHLSRALVTCDDDNIGSARVIEKNGGILQDRIANIVGGKLITTRRYWIDL